MNISNLTAALICSSAIALTGCGSGDGEAGNGGSGDETPTSKSAAAAVPANLFVTAAPADAVPLIDAKTNAKAGDRVVFEARVGGRRSAFVENRAVFFVADPSLKSCDQLHGDSCQKPWDYCCEPQDNLLKHMATVRVVDESGQPLKVSLENEHGLAGLKTVVISGTVGEVDDAGNFVVDAESIHVREG